MYIHIHIHIYIYIRLYTYTYIHMCMCVCVCVCVSYRAGRRTFDDMLCPSTLTYTCSFAYIHIHTCILSYPFAYIHLNTCILTYAYVCVRVNAFYKCMHIHHVNTLKHVSIYIYTHTHSSYEKETIYLRILTIHT